MRYTFQQLLEYQNKRNAECDQSKVDNIVNYILDKLEKKVNLFPMDKKMRFYNVGGRDDEWISFSVDTLTQAERNKIIEVFSDLGFRGLKFIKGDEVTSLEISWE